MQQATLVLLLLGLICFAAARVDYSGQPVIKASIKTASQLAGLQNYLDNSLNGKFNSEERPGAFDVWSRESNLALGVNDILINKPVAQNLQVFHDLNISYEYMIQDVQAILNDPEMIRSSKPNAAAPAWFNSYHTYEGIANYARDLCNLRQDICFFVPNAYLSINQRQVCALHLYGGDAAAPRKQIWINAGQHAREWIAPATLMYILHNLINLYGVNSTVTNLIDNVEFIIVPVVNPDGYDWAWTNDRLWRKNRRNNGAGYGLGVDLNRNWNDHWGQGGSSTNPNSDTYMGRSPFSEPESKGASDYYLKHSSGNTLFAIDYHSYSQLALYPYGWTPNPPPNIAPLKVAAAGIVDAIRTTPGGVVYTPQSSYALYITTGTATDWFHSPSGANVGISFTLEGRDTGRYGFLLPANQIVISGEENWNAFYWLCQHTNK